jgi:hypothetical protein
VRLVLIDGVPFYGDRTLMMRFWEPLELEEISLPGARKSLATPAAAVVVAETTARLEEALDGEGTSLAEP